MAAINRCMEVKTCETQDVWAYDDWRVRCNVTNQHHMPLLTDYTHYFFYKNIVFFFRRRLNILIFLPISGWKYSSWDYFACSVHLTPHSRPRTLVSRSFWSAPRIATSGQVQHRKSSIHGLPVTLRILRVKSDKSDWFQSHSIVFAKPVRTGISLNLSGGRVRDS